MKKKVDLSEILATGTPKQKALLIIEDNYKGELTSNETLLTKKERESIYKSFGKDRVSGREFERYLNVANIFERNRFRLIGLQENLKKLSVMIASYCYIWELSEKCTTFSNTLLEKIGSKPEKTEEEEALQLLIVKNGKGWHRYVKLLPVEGSEPLRLETQTKTIRKIIADIVSDYKVGFGMAKAADIASKEFLEKYEAEEFIPSDVKEALDFVNKPNQYVPSIYRYDEYERLLNERGEDDPEVQIAKKYAVLPSYNMIDPIGLDSYRTLFGEL